MDVDKLRNKTEPSGALDSAAARPRTRRILDVRLLVETLIVAAILAPAAYFWYSYQLKRAAAAMLERAHDLAENNDDRAAAQYYFQYLKLRPDDVDTQVLLAKTYDRAAKGPREKESAVPYFYQALERSHARRAARVASPLGGVALGIAGVVAGGEEV